MPSHRPLVLVTMLARGDVAPFLQLGREARAAGLEVTLISHAGYRAEAETAGLGFDCWDTAEEHQRLAADAGGFNSMKGSETIYATHIVPTLDRQIRTIEAACRNETIIVALAGPCLAARIVAEKRRLPLVTVALGPGYLSPPKMMASMLDGFRSAIETTRAAHSLAPVADWPGWLAQETSCLALWPDWFGSRQPHWPDSLVFAGFLGETIGAHDDGAAWSATFDAPEPPILIACGTGRYLPRDLIERCVTACRSLAPTVLVTPELDLVPDLALSSPNDYPVTHHARLPYTQVLPKVRLVVHHGGIGTTIDALRAGVPQLIVGSGSDRPFNAECVKQLGAGAYLPPLRATIDRVRSMATELMTATVRDQCAIVAERARTTPSLATAILAGYAANDSM